MAVYTKESAAKLYNLRAGKDSAGKIIYKFIEEGTLFQAKDEINPEKMNFDGQIANFLRVHKYHNIVCVNTLTEKKVIYEKEIIMRPKLLLKLFSVTDKVDHLMDYPVIQFFLQVL